MNTHVLSAEEKLVRVTAQEKEYRTAKLDASQLERLYEASLLKQDELHKTEDRLRDLLSNAAEELEQLKFELKVRPALRLGRGGGQAPPDLRNGARASLIFLV